MKKLFKLLLASMMVAGLAVSTASADPVKGQKYFLKLFKPHLGYNGTKFAALHTQAEWEDIFANDGAKFKEEFGVNDSLKSFMSGDKWPKVMPHIKDFAVKYASDSGNVPSC